VNNVWNTVVDMTLDTLRTMAMFWLIKMGVALAKDSGIPLPGIEQIVMAA